MNNLISVIIPVYNREHTIAECIQSVLDQSYPAIEVVLIDDGSGDRSADICRDYEKKDARVRLLCAGHGGVSAARNLGIDAAKGTYLFFLDSDDVIHPALLEALVDGMERSGAAIGGSCVRNIPQQHWHKLNGLIASDCAPGETVFYSHEDTLHAIFREKTPLNMIGGVMMRRDLVGETRFRTDLFIGEDFYFIYENLIKGTGSAFLKQIWYYCRLHGDNLSRNRDFDGFWSRFYRRKLVWESEEALGRKDNADCEKRGAFGCFLNCLKVCDPRGDDARKMRRVIKEHKKTLLPALTLPGKVRYFLAVYFPGIIWRFPTLGRS